MKDEASLPAAGPFEFFADFGDGLVVGHVGIFFGLGFEGAGAAGLEVEAALGVPATGWGWRWHCDGELVARRCQHSQPRWLRYFGRGATAARLAGVLSSRAGLWTKRHANPVINHWAIRFRPPGLMVAALHQNQG